MDIEIIDNFLSDAAFGQIRDGIMGVDGSHPGIPWFFRGSVTDKESHPTGYFYHLFYDDSLPRSDKFSLLLPLLQRLNFKSLIRVKGNLHPRGDVLRHNDKHSDYDFPHKSAIFYINTNDGFTVLEDGTEVESVANRILLFDSSRPHNSTNCTNSQNRVNININYF